MGHYRFHNVWRFAQPARAVYEVLEDGERYPEWWREVREANRIDDNTGTVVCQSVLPYKLKLYMTRMVTDPVALHLKASLDGDLVGWAEWRVRSEGSGSVAEFIQQVDATGIIARMTPIARPILMWNHQVMMRSGERGLRRLLDAEAARPAT